MCILFSEVNGMLPSRTHLASSPHQISAATETSSLLHHSTGDSITCSTLSSETQSLLGQRIDFFPLSYSSGHGLKSVSFWRYTTELVCSRLATAVMHVMRQSIKKARMNTDGTDAWFGQLTVTESHDQAPGPIRGFRRLPQYSSRERGLAK